MREKICQGRGGYSPVGGMMLLPGRHDDEPEMWRKVFKAPFKESYRCRQKSNPDILIDYILTEMWSIIPDLIEIGGRYIKSCSALECMDPVKIKELYGEISRPLGGTIGTQINMPWSAEECE